MSRLITPLTCDLLVRRTSFSRRPLLKLPVDTLLSSVRIADRLATAEVLGADDSAADVVSRIQATVDFATAHDNASFAMLAALIHGPRLLHHPWLHHTWLHHTRLHHTRLHHHSGLLLHHAWLLLILALLHVHHVWLLHHREHLHRLLVHAVLLSLRHPWQPLHLVWLLLHAVGLGQNTFLTWLWLHRHRLERDWLHALHALHLPWLNRARIAVCLSLVLAASLIRHLHATRVLNHAAQRLIITAVIAAVVAAAIVAAAISAS